jgi:hypothetical protein
VLHTGVFIRGKYGDTLAGIRDDFQAEIHNKGG